MFTFYHKRDKITRDELIDPTNHLALGSESFINIDVTSDL